VFPSPIRRRLNCKIRTMKILLADDHAVVRHGVRQILADEFKRATFGEARNAQEALELVWQQEWDIVVLDITMPGRSGLEVLREIKKSKPKLPVLVLSMHPENQFAVRVLKRGASGYMTKESAADELVGAIKKVLAGGRYVSGSLAEKLATYLANDTQKPPQELLSDREFQVLRLIASGKIVSEIARELSLSVKTISTYRTRILEKMGLRNNAELMHYAMEHQLVE
jgi:two-component system, NarL family, invasion response regulator UvrY